MDAVALAAREDADLLLLVRPREVERGDVGPAVDLPPADHEVVLAAGDLLVDGLGVVEAVAALVDIRHLHRRADLDLAAVGLLLTGEHLEQRGLAGAVGADDADDAGLRQREGQVLDEELVAEALVQALDLDHLVAEAVARRDEDLELGVAAFGRLGLLEQLVVGGEAGLALGLAGLGRHAHPLELLVEGPLAVGRLLLLLGEAGGLLLEPARVVALERDAPAAVELEDPAGHVVEEVAVVGDGHDGPGVVPQEPLQPRDRFGVEVVGGLVEQQQVGGGEQEAAQGHAALLTAGEVGDLGVAGRQPQGVHGDLDLAVEVVGALGRDLGFEPGLLLADLLVVGVGVGVLGQALVVLGEQPGHLGHAVEHVVLDVLGLVEVRFLLEHPDGEALGEAGFAREAVVLAGHHLEQRGLAGAVGAEDADLGPGVEGQADVLQHLAVRRVEPGELVHRVDVLGRHASGTSWRRVRRAADASEPG